MKAHDEECADCKGEAVVGFGRIPVWLCMECFNRRLVAMRRALDKGLARGEQPLTEPVDRFGVGLPVST